MIIDDVSTVSEHSPLKSPTSAVTSTRYDAGPAPPPYQPSSSSSSHPHTNHIDPNTPLSPQSLHPTTDEHRQARRRTLTRFFSAFGLAMLIVLVWTSLVEAITLSVSSSRYLDSAPVDEDIDPIPQREPLFSLPFIRWPHVYASPSPCPTVTVTVKPTPTAERLFSIAYPPPTRTAS